MLARASMAEETVRARLDLSAIGRERAQEPALRLRRPTLYAPDRVGTAGPGEAVS